MHARGRFDPKNKAKATEASRTKKGKEEEVQVDCKLGITLDAGLLGSKT